MPREMKKVVAKHRLQDLDEVKQNLEYWLSRLPEERVAEVDRLRAMLHGGPRELKKGARVIHRSRVGRDEAEDAEGPRG